MIKQNEKKITTTKIAKAVNKIKIGKLPSVYGLTPKINLIYFWQQKNTFTT